MQTTWPRITEKVHDEAKKGGTMFANGISFCPVTSFKKYLNTYKTLRMLAIMTMFGTGDDIALSANVPLARKWKTSQKNETSQLSRPITVYVYRHPNTAHYGTQWPQKLKQYPKLQSNRTKREIFEALIYIYGLIIDVVVSFQRRNTCKHTQCSLCMF